MPEIHVFIVSAALALVITFITSALQIAGVISVNVARLLLAAAWIVAIVGVCGSMQNAPAKHLLIAAVATGIPVGIGLIVLERWMTRTVSSKSAKGELSDKLDPPPQHPKSPALSPNTTSKNLTPTAEKPVSVKPSPNLGSGSGAPPYIERPRQPSLMWTDYKEDYFCDLIWRWRYRPEMGDQKPRDITAWCPECEFRSLPMEIVVQQKTGDRVAVFACSQCSPQRRYPVSGFLTDPYDGIRTLIATKLQNGEWKEVVKRQNDVRSGRV